MNSSKAKNAAAKKPAKGTPGVDLFVAPRNGKAGREVVARCGDKDFTDVVDPFKAAAREKFAQRAAKHFGIEDPAALAGLCDQLARKAKEADEAADQMAREAAEAEAEAGGGGGRSAKALAETPPEVIRAAEAFLANPDLMDELEADLEQLGIAGEADLAVTLYLVGTSRKLDKPLGATIKASSSSGKSFVSENVVGLMPPEDVLQATSITQNALFYMPPGELVHKLVVVGERAHAAAGDQADAANATLALRELLSRGRLDKFVPVKGENGIQTQHIVQEGPIAYVDTTTQQVIFEEDESRLLPLATDESPAQTEAIMLAQARQAAGSAGSADGRDAIRRKHQTAQRLLEPRTVRIPFAEHLMLSATKLVARRAFPQLLGFIEAVALLRQRLKKSHDDGHIVATQKDYEIAYRLMLPVLRRAFTPLGDRPKKLLAAILEHSLPGQSFPRNDCVEWVGVGLTEVRNRINPLIEAGSVEQVAGGPGQTCKYRAVDPKAVPAALMSLVKPEKLRKLIEKAKQKSSPAS